MSRRRTASRTTAPLRSRTGAITAAATVVGGAGSALLLSLTAAPAPATVSGTFTVDTLTDGAASATDCTTPVPGSCSLRDALAAALPGDTIEFAPSLFTVGPQTITLDAGQGQLEDTGVNITGPGSHLLTIDADGNSRVLNLRSEVTGTTVSGVTVTNGYTSTGGGTGIRDQAAYLLNLDDVVVTDNTSDRGAGTGVQAGDLNMVDSVVRGNSSARGGGAGIFTDGATVIIDSTVADNSTNACGGGLYFSGSDTTLTVLGTTFSGNSDVSCYGGGIDIDGQRNIVTIANSTFTGNTARVGGAIHADVDNQLHITMTTITGNTSTADDPYYSGGGIHLNPADVVAGSSVAAGKGPTAADGPKASPSLEMVGVILAGNVSTGIGGTADLAQGWKTFGTPLTVQAASSLVGTASVNIVLTGAGLLRGADPKLGPLADNGGPTRTMMPLTGSPVIDAGPATIPEFPGNADDQRGPGFPRTSGPVSDIGAVEVTVPPEPTPEPTFTG